MDALLEPPLTFSEFSFFANAHREPSRDTNYHIAFHVNQRLFAKINRVLSRYGLTDRVALVTQVYHPTNQKFLDVVAKGVAQYIVDEFFPGWRTDDYELHWWKVSDPKYLGFRTFVRHDIKWFDVWAEDSLRQDIVNLLRSEIPEASFFAEPPIRGAPKENP